MNPDNSDDSDRYEIVAELGRGGRGVVLLARHVALDRLVAIKRVAGAFAIDPDARSRLRREAQALGRLDHPNIVHVYDFVSSGDEGLIVMEYVQGESLDRLMAQDLVPTAAATSILADVAAALTHAHERGVVHRDVKPSNVIVASDGQAKLTDFGLARLLASSSALRTRPGTVMGTPEYMAPEQILGEDTDARTDAYAFAAMAYALLTRRPVFDRSDRRALLDAHLLETPVPPADVVAGFPSAASDAIIAGLAKTAAQRPLVADIADAIASVAPNAWPVITPTRVARPPEPAPMLTEGGAPLDQIIVAHHEAVDGGETASLTVPAFVPPRSPRRRGRTIAVYSGVIAIAAIAGGALFASRWHDTPLSVRDVRVTVSPSAGACPRATFTFSASIVGNGGSGGVRVRWVRPDGERTAIQTLRVAGDRTPAHADLRFTVKGETATEVVAKLEVLSPEPASASSPPARYSCH